MSETIWSLSSWYSSVTSGHSVFGPKLKICMDLSLGTCRATIASISSGDNKSLYLWALADFLRNVSMS